MKEHEINERIQRALKGLVKLYDYKIESDEIKLYSKKDHAYNITAVPINALLDEGFFLKCATLTNDNKPMVIFTTYKL